MLGDYKKIDEDKYLSESENPEKEVNVTVTICLHKDVKVKVKDYRVVDQGKDEDGNYFCEEDFSCCDLYEVLPDSVYDEIKKMEEQGWSKDEFEATLDK